MDVDAHPPVALDPERLATDPVVARLLTRCTFPGPHTAVTCAVSGGADSSALLVLAAAAGCDVVAVHVDHGLRPDSSAEAHVVAALAGRLGATFRSVTATVAPGPDLEARARAARHAAVGEDAVFGHTADDQAETVVLRLIRGTGPTGLAAMGPERHPILGLRRRDTRELCRHLGLDVVRDPTNDSPAFTRNRIRHEVLPLLDDVAARDVVPLLCRLAELSAEQACFVDDLAADIDPTDARALAAAPRVVATSAVRMWWCATTGLYLPPDAAATGRVLDVAAGRARSCDVVDGWRVARSGGRLRLVQTRSGDGSPPASGPGGRE